MTDNDFFLKFGSNAGEWAKQLESQLEPARRSVSRLQAQLAKLAENDAAQQAVRRLPGGGERGGQPVIKIDADALKEAIYDQQQSMRALTEDLARVTLQMGRAGQALDRLPGQLANTMRSISTSIARIQEQAQGKSRLILPNQPNQYVAAGTPGAIPSQGWLAQALTNVRNFGPQGPPVSLGRVSQSQIAKADIDRIVNAIKEQTDILKRGIPSSGRSGGGRIQSAASEVVETIESLGEESERSLASAQARLDGLDAKLARALASLGDEADDAMRGVADALRQARAEVAAEVNALERAETGVSRGEQSRRRREEFANRETITNVERDRRLAQQALINSPGASDFDDRLGRARTVAGGNYSKEDLREMADAFRRLGIAVDANTKSSKEQLAAALKAANAQYRRDFPDGHPDLATSGFNIQRVTQVDSAITDLVGDLTQSANEILEARRKIRADRQSGGTGETATTRLESIPGTIGGPGGFAGNWRGGFGAAIGEVAGLISQEALQVAEKRVAANATRMGARALELSRDPNFDPYSIRTREHIKVGQGDEDRALAEAATSAIRDLRLATDELDDFGRRVQQFAEALAENEAFIQRARARIGTDDEKANDRERLRQAEEEIRPRLQQRLQGNEFYLSQEFRAGQARREASRAALEAAREEARNREVTTATFRDMISATGSAVLGVTTAAGSRSLRRNIPGLGFNGTDYFDTRDQSGASPEEMAKVNRAARSLAAAQLRYARSLTEAGEETEDSADALARIEHEADTLARRIARNFAGLAPSLESLTGRAPTSPDVIRDEGVRQETRDRAAAEAARKFAKKTPQEELDLAETALRDTLGARERAERAARDAATRLAAKEAEYVQSLESASRAQKDAAELAQRAYNREYRAIRDSVDQYRAPLSTEDRRAFEAAGGAEENERRRLRNEQLRQSADLAAQARREADARVAQNPLVEEMNQLRSESLRTARELDSVSASSQRAASNVERLSSEIRRVQEAAGRGLNRKQIAEETGVSADRIRSILGPAERVAKAKVAEASATEKVTAATNGRIAELLKERDAIKASGATRRSDLKAAYQAGDTEGFAAIQQRRAELRRIRSELNDLGSGGGSGSGRGGTGGGGTSGAGGRGGSNSLLAQILKTLQEIHTTIRTGVRITGGSGATTGTGPARTRKPATAVEGGATAQEVREARDLKRAEQLAILNADRARLSARRAKGDAQSEARVQREITAATQAADRAARDKVRSEQILRDAMAQTSSQTKTYISDLRRLSEASRQATTDAERLAAQERIVAAQSKVAGGMDADLRRAGLYAADRKKLIQGTLSDAGPKINGEELASIMRTVSRGQTRSAGEEWGGDMGDAALDGFARTFGGNTSFWSRIMHTTGTFIVRNFAAGFVFGLTNALQQVIDQAIQAEATFIRVSAALEATGKDIGTIRGDLQTISADYGVALNDTYETAAALAGLVSNSADLAAATRISSQLQIISNGALNATESVGVLSSTLAAFEARTGAELASGKFIAGGLEGMQKVADVLTSIQNNLGVNLEVSSEGVSRMAGLAREMRLSFEETAVFVSQIAKQTNQTGAGAGEQFSRILASLQGGRARAAITQAFGETTEAGQAITSALDVGDYGQALEQIIRNWDGLTDAQKRNVSTTVAGQRQMAAWQALVNDSSKTISVLTKAQHASGDAEERMEKIMRTINSRLAQFNTQVQSLASNLIQTGLLNFFGSLLVTANLTLDVINRILNALNRMAEASDALGFLRDLGGWLLGAVVAAKLLGTAFRGIQNARASIGRFDEAGPRGPFGVFSQTAGGRARYQADAFGRARPTFREQVSGRAPLTRGAMGIADRLALAPLAGGFGALSDRVKTHNRELERNNQTVSRFRRALERTTTALGAATLGGSNFLRSGPQGGLGNRLGQQGQAGLNSLGQRFFAAEARRVERYAAQQQFRRFMGPGDREGLKNTWRASGVNEAEIARRMRAPQSGLLRLNSSLNLMGRASIATGNAVGKLGAGVSRLGKSGAIADVALAGATTALVLLVDAMREDARIRGVLAKAYPKNPKINDDPSNELDAYVGKAFDEYTKKIEEGMNSSSFDSGLAGVGSIFKEGWRPKNWMKDFSQIAAEDQAGVVFDEAGNMSVAGQAQADKFEKEFLARADAVAGDLQGLSELQNAATDAVNKVGREVQDKEGLTESQRLATVALMEKARQVIQKRIEDLIAQARGLSGGEAWTSEQITLFGELSSLVNQSNGLGQIPQFRELFGEMIDGLGIDGPVADSLRQVASGQASVADAALAQGEYLREQLKHIEVKWRGALASGDKDAAEAHYKTMIGLLQQYSTIEQQIISAITANANQISTTAIATGNFEGALAANERAIRDIEKAYADKYGDLDFGLKQMDALAGRIRTLVEGIAANAGTSLSQYASDLGLGNSLANPPAGLPSGATAGVPTLPGLEGLLTGGAAPAPTDTNSEARKAAKRQRDADATAQLQQEIQVAIAAATQDIIMQLATTTDTVQRARLEAEKARIVLGILQSLNAGQGAAGISAESAKKYGDAAVDTTQLAEAIAQSTQAQAGYIQAQQSAAEEAKQNAEEARRKAAELIQSRFNVLIALAEAAGKTVLVARRQLQAARAQLQSARRGGDQVEINNARAEVIRAEAALRDARLQDDLDTINFNLEMGKITQSAAIAALQQILKTRDLTKAQRRQLMLQIKGMKEEMADSQWNFADIKMPTPYEMRRFIRDEKLRARQAAMQAAGTFPGRVQPGGLGLMPSSTTNTSTTTNTTNATFIINGADTAKVRKIISDVVGGSANTRTIAARRI